MPAPSSPAEETLAQLQQLVRTYQHIGIYTDVLYPTHAVKEDQ